MRATIKVMKPKTTTAARGQGPGASSTPAKTTACAIYARVSTEDKGQDPENQLIQLREYCKRQGWRIAGEYVDHVTGSTDQRPRFQQMFEDARHRKFEAVLFWSLDRFTREGALATLQHLQRLTDWGIGWVSYSEQYLDSVGIFRDAIISIMATLAKQERLRISERTKAGMDRARRAGKHCGRPRRVFRRDLAREMRAQGISLRLIAQKLGVSFMTVKRTLDDAKKPL